MPNIGGHVSTAGGISNSIKNGESIGATSIQIFCSSPQMWFVKNPDEIEINKFKSLKNKSNINSVYIHAPYLINLASASLDIYRKSIKNMREQLEISEMINAEGVIFHLGSNKGIAKEEGLEKEIIGMKEILRSVAGKSKLIMENSAGGGNKIGSCISDLEFLFKNINSDRVKICFDTAHAFEAGMISKYDNKNIKKLFDELEKAVGLKNIIVLHINDSKTSTGSFHDRHENIGEGHIGIDGFRVLSEEKRSLDKDWILEVPGFKNEGPDKKNIDILKSFFE